MKEELLEKRKKDQLDRGWGEPGGRENPVAKEAGQGARAIGFQHGDPVTGTSDPGSLSASPRLGFLLGKIALAMPSLQVVPFLEFSLTLTLLSPLTSSLLPAFARLVAPLGAASPPVACLPLLILLILAETPPPPGGP